MPIQIKRLLIYFAVFIGLFLLVRHLLIPDSFGQYGHYRGLSLSENAAKPLNYAGAESCTECHQDIVDGKDSDLHAELSCEGCHGPSYAHTQDTLVDVPKPSTREFCTHCHAENAGRNRNVIFQINPEEHNAGKDCIECHNPHIPWELKDQENPEETSSDQQ